MKHQKFTSYLAGAIALLASSAAPSYAAIFTSAGVGSGFPTTDLNTIVNEVLLNPSVLGTLDQPGGYRGISGVDDFDTRTGLGTEMSSVDTTLPGTTGYTLTGSGRGRATNNANGLIQFGVESRARLNNQGGAPVLSGAFASALSTFTLTVNATDPGVQPGAAGFLNLSFLLEGTTVQPQGGQAVVGVVAARAPVGGTLTAADNEIGPNPPTNGSVRQPINLSVPITYGQQFDLGLGFASAVAIGSTPGVESGDSGEGVSDFEDTLTFIGIGATDAAGNPVNNFSAVTTIGIDLEQAALVGAATAVPEPPATLGLLLLGAGLGVGSQLKKRKLALGNTAKN